MTVKFQDLMVKVRDACIRPAPHTHIPGVRDARKRVLKLLILEWAGIKFDAKDMTHRTDELFGAYVNASQVSNDGRGRESALEDIKSMFEVIQRQLGEPRPPVIAPEELVDRAERVCMPGNLHSSAKIVRDARRSTLKSLVLEWAGIELDREKIASRMQQLFSEYRRGGLVEDGVGGKRIVQHDIMEMQAVVTQALGQSPAKNGAGSSVSRAAS